MTIRNIKSYRRLLTECFNQGNISVVDELVASDYINHSDNVHGIEQYKQFVRGFRSAFYESKLRIISQSEKGDKVVTRWKVTGIHKYDLMGIPASGKKRRINARYTSIFENGRVKEEWCNSFSIGKDMKSRLLKRFNRA